MSLFLRGVLVSGPLAALILIDELRTPMKGPVKYFLTRLNDGDALESCVKRIIDKPYSFEL